MNELQRYHATAGFELTDRAFLLPPWLWGETVQRWQREGLPGIPTWRAISRRTAKPNSRWRCKAPMARTFGRRWSGR